MNEWIWTSTTPTLLWAFRQGKVRSGLSRWLLWRNNEGSCSDTCRAWKIVSAIWRLLTRRGTKKSIVSNNTTRKATTRCSACNNCQSRVNPVGFSLAFVRDRRELLARELASNILAKDLTYFDWLIHVAHDIASFKTPGLFLGGRPLNQQDRVSWRRLPSLYVAITIDYLISSPAGYWNHIGFASSLRKLVAFGIWRVPGCTCLDRPKPGLLLLCRSWNETQFVNKFGHCCLLLHQIQ